jgi:predicted phosphodiesterase
MKFLAISDTHGLHNQLKLDLDIDCIIHCGDSTNYYDLLRNEREFNEFIEWYANLPVKTRVKLKNETEMYEIDVCYKKASRLSGLYHYYITKV